MPGSIELVYASGVHSQMLKTTSITNFLLAFSGILGYNSRCFNNKSDNIANIKSRCGKSLYLWCRKNAASSLGSLLDR